MKKKIFFIIAAVLVTAFIFNNSAKPAVQSLESSGRFVDYVRGMFGVLGIRINEYVLVTIVRKSAHIFEFAVQSMCIAGCFDLAYRKRIIYILFFGLFTACTDEFIQLFSEGRAGMVSDIFIDFSGVIAGAFAAGIIYMVRRRIKCRD